MGGDGEGGGRGVQDGEHMQTHGRFMSMHGKNHHNIVKISLQPKKTNKKKKKKRNLHIPQLLLLAMFIPHPNQSVSSFGDVEPCFLIFFIPYGLPNGAEHSMCA